VKGIVQYRYGELYGKSRVFYPDNGGLRLEADIVAGKIQGVSREFYPDGALKVETAYADDLKDGAEILYRPTGEMELKNVYRKNRLIETKQYDKAGTVLKEIYY
jgi:antitoxin component YwqK of YwqJK toxin-antitoxin module